ncbi:MAG TPA: glutathione S-transferase [Steroidobacteraceae bacterium]
MITVHHLGASQSERIVWLCEELALPYQLERYQREATGLAPAHFKKLHPMGIAPVITDGDLVLAESGAIIDYLIARHGRGRLAVRPEGANFPEYLYWFHFANGTMMPSELMGAIATMFGLSTDNPLSRALAERAERAFALVEERLGQVDYFAGDELTAADIMMLFSLTTMRSFAKRDISALPNIRAYLARIGARPAYQRAMAKGDPGMQPLLT